jgi:hypothetical protein
MTVWIKAILIVNKLHVFPRETINMI